MSLNSTDQENKMLTPSQERKNLQMHNTSSKSKTAMDLDSPPKKFTQMNLDSPPRNDQPQQPEDKQIPSSDTESKSRLPQAVAQVSGGGQVNKPGKSLAIYIRENGKGYLLVESHLSCGAYGQTSIWLGVSDLKLYVRKIQREHRHGENVKDGTYHFHHPVVPELVSHSNQGPQPADTDAFSNSFAPRVWSTITTYIDGLTLQDTLVWHEKHKKLIPEEEIWECAATLLEVIKGMQYPSPGGRNVEKALFHRDIWPRNIMVEAPRGPWQPGEERVVKYWLIDFGMATRRKRRDGERKHHKDICQVIAIMFAMIMGNMDYESWTWKAVKIRMNDRWPYSNTLWNRVHELEKEVEEATKNDGPGMSKERLEYWSKECRAMSVHYRKPYKKAKWPFPRHLHTKWVPQSRTPILTQSKLDMDILLSGDKKLWGTYQYAWVDPDSLNIISIENKVHWGRKIPPIRSGVPLDWEEDNQW